MRSTGRNKWIKSYFIYILLAYFYEYSEGKTQRPSCFRKFASSGVRRDVWLSLNGGFFLRHLKTDERFVANKPSFTNYLETFDTPVKYGDFYGQRLSTFFIPPKSGEYRFVVTCDSVCEISLSESENPMYKKTIIVIGQKNRTAIDEWNKYPGQQSCYQRLKAHVIYYLEGLHSNYKYRDHMKLRVVFPDSDELRVLDQNVLMNYSTALNCFLLRRECGIQCGGSAFTVLKSVNPITKVCTAYKPSLSPANYSTPTPSSESPLHVMVNVKSSTEMMVQWKFIEYFDTSQLSGFRLSYSYVTSKGSLRTYQMMVGPKSTSVNLHGFRPHTTYCIKITFFAKKEESEPRECTFATTFQGFPIKAPKIRFVRNMRLEAIQIAWNPIPSSFSHGVIQGYLLNLTNLNKTKAPDVVVESGSDVVSMVISGLEKLTLYCVRMLAFTEVGNGPYSDCYEVLTWTEDYLPTMTITNRTSPYALDIQWEALPGYLLGHLTGYALSYTPVSKTGVKVTGAKPRLVNITANTTQYRIAGLSAYTTYIVLVRPLTSTGLGSTLDSTLAETCRCPKFMTAAWSPVPPYTVDTGQPVPSGIIPEILSNMLVLICETCKEFNTTTLMYTPMPSRSKRNTNPAATEMADFAFPLRESRAVKSEKDSPYIPLLEVPGFAYLTTKKSQQVYARQVASSVFQCWPIMVLSLAMTLVVGCIIWFMETVSNPRQFQRKFYIGITEGVWWAFISMTTVGYGDKVPSSKIGRTFAILWFFVGLVIVAMLVGSITSSLSVKILNEQQNVKQERKMASLDSSLEYKVLLNVGKQGAKRETYSNIESLVKAFKQGRAEGIVVDMYMAGFRTDLFNGTWYKVSKIVNSRFWYGVGIGRNVSELAHLFRDYAKNRQEIRIASLKKARDSADVDTHFMAQSLERVRRPDFLDSRTTIFQVTIFILLSTLCGCSIVGMLFHLWRRDKHHDVQNTDVYQCREHYLNTKEEMKQVLDEFHRRVCRTYLTLKAKHRREIKELVRLNRHARANGQATIWI
ncbi:uncharacterized protein LOC5519070 isoform X1 [Nematostella vectensis]|uniref:uncharacterized protein LOC5519070 isoform X1 n=1 Tax=Nematostella vectensis TaxID=45351 RepID=UPI002077859D|nr:uncharacterized protein LOC5519070 isoform X1 [Nematostella vectensis]